MTLWSQRWLEAGETRGDFLVELVHVTGQPEDEDDDRANGEDRSEDDEEREDYEQEREHGNPYGKTIGNRSMRIP